MARSRDILGPYELDPEPLVITSRQSPGNVLQKAGHGEIVDVPGGETYLVHLASRVHYPQRRSLLGRETCIQKVAWKDGWLRLTHGGTDPRVDAPAPAELKPHAWPSPSEDFLIGGSLNPIWQTLRVPLELSWADLKSKPGHAILRGRESIASLFEQSLLARRIESMHCRAQTTVRFSPAHFTQSAGLIAYYDTRQNFYCRVTHDEKIGRVIELAETDDGAYREHLASRIAVNDWQVIHLRADIDSAVIRFSASPDGAAWQPVGGDLDFTKLSDDYGGAMRFTGPMIGICCQDLNEASAWADFGPLTMQDHSPAAD
jgi:xylan 1,4-beta-xylosidase